MSYINIADLTSTTDVNKGIANGSGVFDKLMNSVNLYLDDQYTSGRLKGTDYANVLLGSIQTVLTQSVQFVLQEKLTETQIAKLQAETTNLEIQGLLTSAQKDNTVAEGLNIPKQGSLMDSEIALKAQQLSTGTKQQQVMDSQIALYNRQKESFDDNKFQKLLEAQMNYNSMIFSDADVPVVLGISGENAVNDIFNRITGKDMNVNVRPE